MRSLDPEIGKIRREIQEFDNQIEDMHRNVHKYLSDRKRNPHPRHEEFLSKILNYKIRGVKSRELEVRLDSVQFKAANRAKIWKQWFEDDAKGLFRKSDENIVSQGTEKSGMSLMNQVYERTKENWSKFDVKEIESKEKFIERILPAYNKARRDLKKGEKLAFVYDKDIHRVVIKIKKNNNR